VKRKRDEVQKCPKGSDNEVQEPGVRRSIRLKNIPVTFKNQ